MQYSESQVQALKEGIDKLESQLLQVEKDRIEYLQNVSHQLVAPLNAMKWHIENLTNGRLGVDRAKKVLRSIYSQATIAVHLAKNFALMSNLESDHALSTLKEPLVEVNLCQLLVNLADDFQPFGWEREIKIEVDDEELNNVPPVLAMKPLISQVFSNIIENAVKYSLDSTRVVISGAHSDADDCIVIEIVNRGIGISDADELRVFDRGFRSARAKLQYPAGTGFGLFIAKKIVDIHQGSIAAFTDDSGLTVFSVTLPRRALEGRARTLSRPPLPPRNNKSREDNSNN